MWLKVKIECKFRGLFGKMIRPSIVVYFVLPQGSNLPQSWAPQFNKAGFLVQLSVVSTLPGMPLVGE